MLPRWMQLKQPRVQPSVIDAVYTALLEEK